MNRIDTQRARDQLSAVAHELEPAELATLLALARRLAASQREDGPAGAPESAAWTALAECQRLTNYLA